MRGLILTAVVLLSFQYVKSVPVETAKQFVYSYEGTVISKSSLSEDIISQWGVLGKLTIQQYGNYSIIKLDDLKTSLYNGQKSQLHNAKQNEIPPEANVLTEPFVIHYDDGNQVEHISLLANEPMWSVNMKRSIVSILNFVFDLYAEQPIQRKEKNIYGECTVFYESKDEEDGFVITKTIHRSSCDEPIDEWSNVPSVTHPFTTKEMLMRTKRIYTIKDKNNMGVINRVETYSNAEHKTMSSERSNQQIDQIQVFELLDQFTVENKIDITRNTVNKDLTFEFSKSGDKGGDRHIPENRSDQELINKFDKYSTEFSKEFKKIPLDMADVRIHEILEHMYTSLEAMDAEALQKLHTYIGRKVMDEKTASHMDYAFLSLLPYVGTNAAVKFMKDALIDDDVSTDLLTMRLMMQLPYYIDKPNEQMLTELEDLTTLNKTTNNQIKYAGILSFPIIVANAHDKETCNDECVKKYVNKYYKLFQEADEYELKMIYLLGMINFANEQVCSEILVNVISNSEESRHIRTLVTTAAKKQLVFFSIEVFNRFWPLVKNHTEPFEVRVALLDLLLEAELERDQFNTILEHFMKEPSNIHDEHLYNYFYTSIQSLYKITDLDDSMNKWATDALPSLQVPTGKGAWLTGNYKIKFQDEPTNFGAFIQARLVGDPITNAVNIVQLSLNQFAMSLNLGTLSVYVKLEGLSNGLFHELVLNHIINNIIPIPQLFELLQKNNFKLKVPPSVHVEVVVFASHRAVFGIHLNADNINEYTDNPMLLDAVKLLMGYTSILLPALDESYVISDLGTPLTASIEQLHIFSQNIENFDKFFDDKNENVEYTERFRNMWSTYINFESYNPINDVTVGTYKLYGHRELIMFPFTVNPYGFHFTWENRKDLVNIISDNLIGTYVKEKDALKIFCQDCETRTVISNENHVNSHEEFSLEPIGLKINVTVTNCSPSNISEILEKIVETHRANYLVFPPAKPFLLALHFLDNELYLSPRDTCSVSLRSLPFHEEKSESVVEFAMKLDSFYKNDDPYYVKNINVSLAFTNKRIKDNHIFRHWNMTLKAQTVPKTLDKNSKRKIDHNYSVHIDNVYNDGTKAKFCLDTEILFPSRRKDKFQVKPYEPTKSRILISWGIHDLKTKTCPINEATIEIIGVSSVAPEQIDRVNKMEEFKTCKQKSLGLQFTPPDKSCLKAYNKVSRYTKYEKYFRFNNMPTDFLQFMDTINHYMGILEPEIPEGFLLPEPTKNLSVTFDVEHKNVKILANEHEIKKSYKDYERFVDFFLIDPSVENYEEYFLTIGLENTCIITPKHIKPLIGKEIKIPHNTVNVDQVAYVDCVNNTRNGLTFKRLNDKHLSFKLWSNNNELTVGRRNGKLRVWLNGKEQTKQTAVKNENFNIFFIDTNVIYIKSSLVNIYYNTEYIFIKTFAIYNGYACGLCGNSDEV